MDGRRRRRSRRPGSGASADGGTQVRVRLCAKGLRAQRGACRARPRPPGRRRRPTLAQPRAEPAHLCSPRRSRRLGDHPERRRLARRGRGGVPACPRRPAARAVVGGRRRRGTGSNARRSPPTAAGARPRRSSPPVRPASRRAVPLREAHAVAARIGAKPLLRELELLAQRARLDLAPPHARDARPTSRASEKMLGLTPREAEVLDARRPRLHQPRDRRDARHQRQDGQRPRLAHPAQARRAEPTGGGRDRPPPRAAERTLIQHLRRIWRKCCIQPLSTCWVTRG